MCCSPNREAVRVATGYTEKNVISSLYISSFQAQAVPNNFIQLCAEMSTVHHEAYNETTPDIRQSKTSILSTNVDKKVRNKVFDIQ